MENVRKFAADRHRYQKYGEHDYIVHLDDVFCVALEFDLDSTVTTAAYLHDILEDTSCTFEELWKEFGWEVAQLVFLVTDEKGSNRKERKTKTYLKTATNYKAVQLKLADRLANVRHAKKYNLGLFKMYKNEHSEFLAGLQIMRMQEEKIVKMFKTLSSLFENE